MSKMKFDVNAISLDAVGRVILSDERLRVLEQASENTAAGGTTVGCDVNSVGCDCNGPGCELMDGIPCEPSNGSDCINWCSNDFWCT